MVFAVNENEANPLQNGIFKYVAGEHMESKNIYITKFGNINVNKEVLGSAFHRKFSKGDILFGTRRAYLKKAGIVTFDGICANTTLVLRPKHHDFVKGLLPFIVQWEKFTEFAVAESVGSTNPYVRWRDLSAFEFYLPPLDEQLKTNTLFWSIQKSIDLLQVLINKLTIYKASKADQLLSGKGLGHKKFKRVGWLFDKKIEIPEEWKWEKLGDNSTLKGRIGWQGLTTTEYKKKGNYYLVTGTDFKDGQIDWGNCVYVDEERYSQDLNIQLRKNDVLVTKDGTIGKVAFVSFLVKPATLNSGVFVIRPINSHYSPLFLYYILFSDFFKKFLNRLQAGSTINHLYQKDFVNFRFPIPPLTEQQKITSILSRIDTHIDTANSHLLRLKVMRRNIINERLTPPRQESKIVH